MANTQRILGLSQSYNDMEQYSDIGDLALIWRDRAEETVHRCQNLSEESRLCFLDNHICVHPDPCKQGVRRRTLDQALSSRKLQQSEASKLAGRLLFSRNFTFGGVGSAQLRRIFHHANAIVTTSGAPLARVLLWWRIVLENGLFRRRIALLSLHSSVVAVH